MRIRAAAIASVALASAAVATPARAEVHDLRGDTAIDVAITITGLGLVTFSEIGKPDLAPRECRVCEPPPVDAGIRDALRWDRPKTAAFLSDATAFLIVPGTTLGALALAASHDDASNNTPFDTLVVVEAFALSAAANQLVKYTVARERPYSRYRTNLWSGPDDNLSFYSGHTGLTATLAAAAGTVSYLRGYRLAPLTWAVPGALSIVTGYLRIAADKHYFTDVVVGALVGTAFGIGVPLLFHPRDPGPAPPAPTGFASPRAMEVFSLGGSF